MDRLTWQINSSGCRGNPIDRCSKIQTTKDTRSDHNFLSLVIRTYLHNQRRETGCPRIACFTGSFTDENFCCSSSSRENRKIIANLENPEENMIITKLLTEKSLKAFYIRMHILRINYEIKSKRWYYRYVVCESPGKD